MDVFGYLLLFSLLVLFAESYLLTFSVYVTQGYAYLQQSNVKIHEIVTYISILLIIRLWYFYLWLPFSYDQSDSSPKGTISRKAGSTPPPFPNGWFALCLSEQIKHKGCKDVHVLGQHLVVYRTEKGEAAILDAYCPHLGANLAIGGVVEGDCIVCPFHGWAFAPDGQCTKIAYSEKVPKFAKVNSWPVLEINGVIYVWHHVEHRAPEWQIPKVTSGLYQGFFRSKIAAHIQEIPERAARMALLGQTSEKLENSMISIKNENAKWTVGQSNTGDSHLAYLNYQQKISVFGIPMPLFSATVEAVQVGPSVTQVNLKTIFGTIKVVENITPLSAMLQENTITVHAPLFAPRLFTKMIVQSYIDANEKQMKIWNSKTYHEQPLLLQQQDQPLLSFRSWYQHFYSDPSSSSSVPKKKENLEW